MTGTNCDLFTYKSSLSYLNHLVLETNNLNIFVEAPVFVITY
jgi:hypothetical protein